MPDFCLHNRAASWQSAECVAAGVGAGCGYVVNQVGLFEQDRAAFMFVDRRRRAAEVEVDFVRAETHGFQSIDGHVFRIAAQKLDSTVQGVPADVRLAWAISGTYLSQVAREWTVCVMRTNSLTHSSNPPMRVNRSRITSSTSPCMGARISCMSQAV